jgi:hypothetical protein
MQTPPFDTRLQRSRRRGGLMATSTRYTCDLCGTSYSLLRNLQLHVKNVHGADARDFICVYCSHVCKSKQSYRSHMNSKHRDKKGHTMP